MKYENKEQGWGSRDKDEFLNYRDSIFSPLTASIDDFTRRSYIYNIGESGVMFGGLDSYKPTHTKK